jgi:hypothetical protein
MAVLKEIVLTAFYPQIITKTINIKTISILFSRQDSAISSWTDWSKLYDSFASEKGNHPLLLQSEHN